MRPVAAVGVALALTALGMQSASADDSQISLSAGLLNMPVVPANGVATEVDVAVNAFDSSGSTTTEVDDVTVEITLPTSGPVTAAISDPRCAVDPVSEAGNVWSCLIPSMTTDYNTPVLIPVMMTAPVGTPAGTEADLTVTASAPNATGTSYPYPESVEVVDGPNLIVTPTQSPTLSLNRGDKSALPQITVTNDGTQPAQGVTINFGSGYYLDFAHNQSNCALSAPGLFGTGLICYVDAVIQPGETYVIADAPAFRVRNDVPPGASDSYQVTFTPGDETADMEQYNGPYTTGTGTPLALKRTVGTGPLQTTTQSVQQDNFPNNWSQDAAGGNVDILDGIATDLAVIGDHAAVTGTGAAAAATVEVGVRDAGPATLINRAGTGVAHVQFTVPSGATVTAAPSNCMPVTTDGSWPQQGAPGYSVYDCFPYALKAHTRAVWDFTLTLAPGVTKATGSVMIHYVGDSGPGPFPDGWDSDPTNDTAPVVVTAS
jgi:hypothetical protein